MPQNPSLRETRNDWLRLRTLVLLRWMAIAGQMAAILVGALQYDLKLPIGACLLIVGLAVIVNLALGFVFPENKRLAKWQAALVLLFDLAQLSLLLGITGGLANPFALLILAPVTIAATVLDGRSTLLLGLSASIAISILALVNLPLVLGDGSTLALPPLFAFGFWLAILIGIAFLGLYAYRVSSETRAMQDALLATQMALAREQKLTDLGGVVAAAAHELGTPLATIKLVSSELLDDLKDPDHRADAQLIRDQADRCRDILRSMGRAGKDDKHLQLAPLGTVLHEAAEPHLNRGKTVTFRIGSSGNDGQQEPIIQRRPEVIHGLRNLIQNAVDFAESTVWIDGEWQNDSITIRVVDDGQGYPAHVIGRIGDPFMRGREARPADPRRPEYEGMGLGLFIAKTLLERTGAELSFANGTAPFAHSNGRPQRCGAIVEAVWKENQLRRQQSGGLGDNEVIVG